jgi:adenylate cyclase
VENLQQNVRLVAGDYGFKAAYRTEDTGTIKTALQNHQYRLKDADLMILCDLDGLVLSNTFSDSMNGEPFPWMPVLDEAYDSDSGEVTAYAELDGTVYQLAVTPLLAPDLDAWIISGFRADHNMAIDLSALTSSDVTFVRDSGANTRLVASSLGSEQQTDLITFLQSAPLSSGLVQYRDNRETYIGNLIRLPNAQGLSISIFVQQSLDAALDPYRELFWYSLLIFLAAIVMFAVAVVRTSRSVTSPITRLSAAAESVSKGQLDITLPVSS